MRALGFGARLGLILILLLTICALFAPWIAPHDPTAIDPSALSLAPFESRYLLGTDDVGRDTLSRLIWGARLSLGVGVLVVTIAASIGISLGVLAGFFGGFIDRTIMRLIDILMSLPSILLALVVMAILGPGLENAVLAVAIVAIPSFTRVARASVFEQKEMEYITAARSLGASKKRLVFKHILPNMMGPLIVQMSLGISDAILNVAALGFLGLGAEPPAAEWGTMLSDARAYIQSAPWMVTLPGIMILISVLSFNLLGDGLRDWLDPKTKLKQRA
jgi:ABC-type dipeptide/oligopeptide/nickel transport system permease subunit